MEYRPGRHNLIAVLDWGLGHASRSLALAKQLVLAGEKVSWAAAGAARHFLVQACPEQTIHSLPAYQIQYYGSNMHWNIARQLPKILRTVLQEQLVCKQLVRDLKVDRLISDSRFGAWSANCDTVFLSHQLNPIFGLPFVDILYRRWLQKFDSIWVPDHAGPNRLSGKLSDPTAYKNVTFIGPLSRFSDAFQTSQVPNLSTTAMPIEEASPFDLVCLLSGPEPQRSKLETMLRKILPQVPGKHILVQGKPNNVAEDQIHGNYQVVSFTDWQQTQWLLEKGRYIICRSGYSSLMDLQALNKTALLIPTPGQTEQVYLAHRAQQQGWAKTFKQEQLLQELPNWFSESDLNNGK